MNPYTEKASDVTSSGPWSGCNQSGIVRDKRGVVVASCVKADWAGEVAKLPELLAADGVCGFECVKSRERWLLTNASIEQCEALMNRARNLQGLQLDMFTSLDDLGKWSGSVRATAFGYSGAASLEVLLAAEKPQIALNAQKGIAKAFSWSCLCLPLACLSIGAGTAVLVVFCGIWFGWW